MNVVDSSGWIEFLTDGPNAPALDEVLSDSSSLLGPAVVVFEVFKWMTRERRALDAAKAVATMSRAPIVELDRAPAVAAAQLSLRHRLAMADSIILATAHRHRAMLWTQDIDFKGIEGVRYLPRA